MSKSFFKKFPPPLLWGLSLEEHMLSSRFHWIPSPLSEASNKKWNSSNCWRNFILLNRSIINRLYVKTFFSWCSNKISIDPMIVEEINPLKLKLVIEHLMPEIYQQQGMHCASSKVIMTAPRWTLMTMAGQEQRPGYFRQSRGWQEVLQVNPPGMAKSKVLIPRKSSWKWAA